MDKIIKLSIMVVTFGIAVQSIYTAFFGVWDPLIHRPMLMAAGAFAALLLNPLVEKYPTDRTTKKVLFWVIDLAMLAVILSACYFYIEVGEELENGLFDLDIRVYYLALAGVLVLMELTRRAPVCVRSTPPLHIESCGAAIMRPATGDFWAVWGPPADGEYERFQIGC